MNYRSKNEPHECKNHMCPIHFEPIDDGIEILKIEYVCKKTNEKMYLIVRRGLIPPPVINMFDAPNQYEFEYVK